ncbi:MAG: sigma-54 dependent transcriptional regulator [Proteobacteria bacterium]|nr:sigma-54 dependent transcriptional regulator [Pseudomonadota bacterium]
MASANILVVDDEKNIRRTVSMVLQDEDYEVETASSAEEGLGKLVERSFDVVLLDVQMGGMSGLEMLAQVREQEGSPEVIMMSGHASLADAVDATRLGAFDFLEKPLNRERLLLTVRNAYEKRLLMMRVQSLEAGDARYCGMIGDSPAMQKIRTAVEIVGPTKGKVLILGESGVGKDLVARSIHALSDRSMRSFVKVNCSAIPSELIESELFGHEKGSFTGASARKRGLFEAADGGTIFLDEIGDMSLAAQAKVLRVLQSGEFTRVGGDKLSFVDVRVIAATNKDLKRAVVDGEFREDLYFRLNVVPIQVPPLRERLSDIPLLVNSFLSQIAREYGRELLTISDKAMAVLCRYSYPGNIRELHNLCERLVIMCRETVTVGDLPEDMMESVESVRGCTKQGNGEASCSMASLAGIEPGAMSLREFRSMAEQAYIEATLKSVGNNVSRAAEVLNIERTNLHKKIKKFDVERPGDDEV